MVPNRAVQRTRRDAFHRSRSQRAGIANSPVKNILAIDFGTSNSTVGYCSPTGPKLLPIEDGKLTIPSAIFFNIEEDNIQFGREAIAAYTNHYEGRLLRALKSILGSALLDESTQIGEQSVSFKEIVAHFLWHLKTTAEATAQCEFDTVVLGRPVRFDDRSNERDAYAQAQLESIAKACGFKTVYFQFEPIAAALDYESRLDREEIALIADIGGGTSDFSIVRVSAGSHRKTNRAADILASSGVHVGGTDLDRALSLLEVMPHLGYRSNQRERPELELPSHLYFDLASWHRIFLLQGDDTAQVLKQMHSLAARPELVHRLIRVIREQRGYQLASDVERAKIALSDQPAAQIALPYIEEGFSISFDRYRMNAAIDKMISKISTCLDDCIMQAEISSDKIDTVFVTGGASATPAIQECCVRAAPKAKVVEGDRFASVGLGLTIEALIRAHEQAD